MTSVGLGSMDFEEEAKKAREYYMCMWHWFLFEFDVLFFFCLDGDYTKGITFYKLAIDKLRRHCQTVSNLVEKKRSTEVRALKDKK